MKERSILGEYASKLDLYVEFSLYFLSADLQIPDVYLYVTVHVMVVFKF